MGSDRLVEVRDGAVGVVIRRRGGHVCTRDLGFEGMAATCV
jgi:hypothetical protein